MDDIDMRWYCPNCGAWMALETAIYGTPTCDHCRCKEPMRLRDYTEVQRAVESASNPPRRARDPFGNKRSHRKGNGWKANHQS